MAVQKINLSQDLAVNIVADWGVIYFPSFENIPQLDNSYTLVLDEGLPTEVTYGIGTGLTLAPTAKGVVWNLDTSLLQKKRYTGYLESADKLAGKYLKIVIYLDLK